MTWEDLFARGDASDVTEADVVAALRRHRTGEGGEREEREG